MNDNRLYANPLLLAKTGTWPQEKYFLEKSNAARNEMVILGYYVGRICRYRPKSSSMDLQAINTIVEMDCNPGANVTRNNKSVDYSNRNWVRRLALYSIA